MMFDLTGLLFDLGGARAQLLLLCDEQRLQCSGIEGVQIHQSMRVEDARNLGGDWATKGSFCAGRDCDRLRSKFGARRVRAWRSGGRQR
jgi:hypothetical protein